MAAQLKMGRELAGVRLHDLGEGLPLPPLAGAEAHRLGSAPHLVEAQGLAAVGALLNLEPSPRQAGLDAEKVDLREVAALRHPIVGKGADDRAVGGQFAGPADGVGIEALRGQSVVVPGFAVVVAG